jgi:hypothetical protein
VTEEDVRARELDVLVQIYRLFRDLPHSSVERILRWLTDAFNGSHEETKTWKTPLQGYPVVPPDEE